MMGTARGKEEEEELFIISSYMDTCLYFKVASETATRCDLSRGLLGLNRTNKIFLFVVLFNYYRCSI